MILIDETYFKGELSLPNILITEDGACHGVKLALQSVGENNLNDFANKYIVEYLIRLFGQELATKLIEESMKVEPVEIWSNLINKLLIEIADYKASPLANYVYYWIMRDSRTKNTQAGEADPSFDNAYNANNNHKMIKAWNDMVEMTISIHNWFCVHYKDYEEYTGCSTGRKVSSITQSINMFGI